MFKPYFPGIDEESSHYNGCASNTNHLNIPWFCFRMDGFPQSQAFNDWAKSKKDWLAWKTDQLRVGEHSQEDYRVCEERQAEYDAALGLIESFGEFKNYPKDPGIPGILTENSQVAKTFQAVNRGNVWLCLDHYGEGFPLLHDDSRLDTGTGSAAKKDSGKSSSQNVKRNQDSETSE